jgi:hypothetical protein
MSARASNIAGDQAGKIIFNTYAGASGVQEVARVEADAETGIGTGSSPGALLFSTTPNGSMAVAERMRITSSGNVGIGTTNPASKLDVNGTVTATGFSGPFSTSVGTFGLGTVGAPSITFTGDTNTGWWSPGADTIAASTNGAERVRIDSSGRVGIGTNNPASPLQVNGAAAVGSGTSGAPTFTFSSELDTGIFNPAADIMGFSTAGIERMRLDNNGHLNIGSTSAATYKLEVAGADNPDISIRVWNDNSTSPRYPGLIAQNYIGTAGSGAPQVYLANSRGGSGTPSPIQSGDILGFLTFAGTYSGYNNYNAAEIRGMAAQTFTTGAGGGVLQFLTSSIGTNVMAERMRITDSGNVGIGSTNPVSKLDVNGTITATGFSGPLSTSVGTFGLGTVGAPSITFTGDTNTGWWSPGADTIAASTAGAERVRIDSSGRVGIGTTNPATKLDVASISALGSSTYGGGTDFLRLFAVSGSAFSEPAIVFQENGTNVGAKIAAKNTANGAYDIIFANRDTSSTTSTMTERMRINSGGNVGIGTATPDTVLAVNSNTTGLQSTSGLAGTVFHLNGADGTKTRMVIDGYGASSTPSLTFRDARGTGAAPSALQSGDMVAQATFSGYGASAYSASNVFMGYWATENWTNAANGTALTFYTTPNGAATTVERLRIDQNGNVGIGTTNPSELLEVNGNTRVAGQLSTGSQVITGGTTSINWNNGNSISTDYDCASAFSFANLRDGGTYTLVVTGTGTTQCTFSTTTTGTGAGTVSYRFKPANAARTATSHTVYTLMRVGSIVYVSWASGF